MVESTKIREGREDGEGSGEEMKGREVGMAGEECGRVTTGSSAWPLLILAYSELHRFWPLASCCSSSSVSCDGSF